MLRTSEPKSGEFSQVPGCPGRLLWRCPVGMPTWLVESYGGCRQIQETANFNLQPATLYLSILSETAEFGSRRLWKYPSYIYSTLVYIIAENQKASGRLEIMWEFRVSQILQVKRILCWSSNDLGEGNLKSVVFRLTRCYTSISLRWLILQPNNNQQRIKEPGMFLTFTTVHSSSRTLGLEIHFLTYPKYI